MDENFESEAETPITCDEAAIEFGSFEENILIKIGTLPKHDATYIRQLVKIAYKNELPVLHERSLTGRGGIKPLTTIKKNFIIGHFEKRIKEMKNIESVGRSTRLDEQYVNKRIKRCN